jgi:hypothetical protein
MKGPVCVLVLSIFLSLAEGAGGPKPLQFADTKWRLAANILNKVQNSRQGMVLQLGGWARCCRLLTAEYYRVTKHSHCRGLGPE